MPFLAASQRARFRAAFRVCIMLFCLAFGFGSRACLAFGEDLDQGHQSEAAVLLAANSIDEIWKKSQSLRPQPSTDTTLVSVKMGSVAYKIPRNYISNVNVDNPVLKGTYPGFEPLREETRGCFNPKLRDGLGCTTLELNLRLSLPNKPRFENSLKLVSPEQKNSPRQSDDGYQVYLIGPENARIEIYRSESEDIFFACKIFYYDGERKAVCDDTVSLPDGNAVWFFFRSNQVTEVRHIEAGVRELMARFQEGASK
jgi:hypothetical protein